MSSTLAWASLSAIAVALLAGLFRSSAELYGGVVDDPGDAASERAVRRRVLGIYNVAALVLGPLYTTFFLLFGAWWTALGPAYFAVASIAAYVLYRKRRDRASAVLLVWAIWTGPAWCVLTTGALYSALMIWMAPSAFMAGPLLGRRASVYAGAASVVFVAANGLLPGGFPEILEMSTGLGRPLLYVLCGTTAIALIAFYGFSTTGSYEDARSKLEEKNAELAGMSAELDYGNRAMLRVLDNVDQGLLTVDRTGRVAGRWSAIVERWLGQPCEGMPLWELVAPHSAVVADSLRLGFEALVDDFLPAEVVLGQLPSKLRLGQKHVVLDFALLADGGVLIKLTDVTDHVARESAEVAQAQMLAVFQHFRRDRAGVVTFMKETEALMSRMRDLGHDQLPALRRGLHTVKGNASLFGLTDIAERCHHLEDVLAETGELPHALCDELCAAWKSVRDEVCEMIGRGAEHLVEVRRDELRDLAGRIERRLSPAEAAQAVHELSLDRVEPQLSRLAEQARALAERLDKPGLVVTVDAGDDRTDPGVTAGLFASLVHVIRNAIDHGIETPDTRVAAGKSGEGYLRLSARRRGGELIVQVDDDGAGIAWERVAAAARKRGLPVETPGDLQAALFADGVSTRDVVTELSGRGVGTTAVLQEVQRLGGRIEVTSAQGKGTTFTFVIPAYVERLVPAAA